MPRSAEDELAMELAATSNARLRIRAKEEGVELERLHAINRMDKDEQVGSRSASATPYTCADDGARW